MEREKRSGVGRRQGREGGKEGGRKGRKKVESKSLRGSQTYSAFHCCFT